MSDAPKPHLGGRPLAPSFHIIASDSAPHIIIRKYNKFSKTGAHNARTSAHTHTRAHTHLWLDGCKVKSICFPSAANASGHCPRVHLRQSVCVCVFVHSIKRVCVPTARHSHTRFCAPLSRFVLNTRFCVVVDARSCFMHPAYNNATNDASL